MTASKDRLIPAFYKAARFLIDRIKNDGWHWSSNYLREHVRCTTDLKFSNTISPEMLSELKKRYPDISDWIVISGRKPRSQKK